MSDRTVNKRLVEKEEPMEFDISLWERLNSYMSKRIDYSEMNEFLFSPLPKDKILNCKIVMRCDNNFEKIYPRYFLYIYNNDKFLLSAKKIFKATSTNYFIYNSEGEMSENSDSYVGKISSNFLSTEFNIYDKGKKPSKSKIKNDIRVNYGMIVYV